MENGSDSSQQHYWRMMNQCAFTVSPPGQGWDCYRTWESLYMGSIPILLRSQKNLEPLSYHTPRVGQPDPEYQQYGFGSEYPDPESYPRSETGTLLTPADQMYDDMPVLMVDDYTQITREFLVDAYENISKRNINLGKLRAGFWKAQIDASHSRHDYVQPAALAEVTAGKLRASRIYAAKSVYNLRHSPYDFETMMTPGADPVTEFRRVQNDMGDPMIHAED
jgi:hypothetical protein